MKHPRTKTRVVSQHTEIQHPFVYETRLPGYQCRSLEPAPRTRFKPDVLKTILDPLRYNAKKDPPSIEWNVLA